jgi:surfactin synthase thioesterase subunit
VRLLCFPPAGGGASTFRQWADLLPGDIDVCSIQLPGRESRFAEAPFSRLGPAVEALLEALEPLTQSPFALFGHSMGALVAFELARALRAAGRPTPAHLFIAARRAPQLPDLDPPIHRLPDDALLAEIPRLNGTPPEVLAHVELMRLMLPVLRADFTVCETYDYVDQLPLTCPISAFAGSDDAMACREPVAAWRTQTTSRFRVHVVDGGHFFVRTSAAAVVNHVSADLMETLRLVAI